MHVDDFNDPDIKVVYIKPFVAITLLAIVVFGGLGLAFREDVGNWITGLRGSSADSIRGEWVGELDIPNMNDQWIRPIHQHAVIRFVLQPTKHYLHKYGGLGELTIQGQSPQPIEVKDLWPSGTGVQSFETGIWKVPYHEGDKTDFVSGGFDGTFRAGQLTLTRQTDVGYDMSGTLHKGTDQEYDQLVQQMRSK
jgi:hypothetical protein